MRKRENNNNLLTLTEVIERLKITRRTAYNWIKSGALKASRAGRSYRVSAQDLETFIKPSPGKKKRAG